MVRLFSRIPFRGTKPLTLLSQLATAIAVSGYRPTQARGFAMKNFQERQKLRDGFFQAMLAATVPLQQGPDQEVTLQVPDRGGRVAPRSLRAGA